MKYLISILLLISSQVVNAQLTQIINANGYTIGKDEALVRFSSMLIEDGKVVSISIDKAPEVISGANIIDVKNRTLLPGLIDAHGHLLGLGATLLQVDVRDITSAKKTAQKVQKYAKQNHELKWITGRGWNQVLWPDKNFPTADVLDEYVNNKPVWLRRVDGHAGWANSEALAIAGITKDTIDPQGGKILRDKDGNPSGVLIDNAMYLLEKHLPKNNEDFLAASLEAAGEHLLGLGITSMHDAGINHDVYHFYQQRAEQGSLPVRIYPMISATDERLVDMLKAGYVEDDSGFLSIRSVKAYGDGALGSRGAALKQPYADAHDNTGLLVTRKSDIKPLFDLVLKHNFQLNFHAIGDRANQIALDQYEDTFSRVGGKSLRHRVEHAQIIDVADIPRFKSLGIIPSMQPTHATSDMNMAEDRVGKARLEGSYAWQTFLQQGSRLAFGSDFPVELANPFFGLHAAVTRQDRENQPKNGWIPEQALTVEQAFKAFTYDAAYAAHQEQQLGSLTKGLWADFIIIDKDIFTIAPSDIWKAQVLETWIAGEQVFAK